MIIIKIFFWDFFNNILSKSYLLHTTFIVEFTFVLVRWKWLYCLRPRSLPGIKNINLICTALLYSIVVPIITVKLLEDIVLQCS